MSDAAGRTPRRVLLTTDTVGGVWTHTVDLAGALGAEGIEVAIAALGSVPRSDQLADATRVLSALTESECTAAV